MSEIQGKPVYGVCACKEKRQVLSVDQAVDLIQQMAENNWQVPDGYLPKTTVNGIVEQNTKSELELWVGIQADWDALTTAEQANKFAIITDDATLQEIETRLNNLTATTESHSSLLSQITSGVVVVPEATHAVNADVAEEAVGAWKGVRCNDGFTALTCYLDGRLHLQENDTFIEQKRLLHYGEVSTTVNEDGKTVTPIVIDVPSQAGELKVGDWLEFELRASLDSNYTRQTIMIDELKSFPVYRNLIVQGCASNGTFQFRSINISLTSTQIQILHNYPTDSLLDLQPVYLLRAVKIVGAAL